MPIIDPAPPIASSPAPAPASTVQPGETLNTSASEALQLTDEGAPNDKPEGAAGDTPAEGEKKQKTPEQREIERLRRAIDKRTRQLYEARAMSGQNSPIQQGAEGDTNASRTQATDEPVTLSRAELQKLIRKEAEQLAPAIKQQQTEIEHRQKVVQTLAKEWGQEKFDAYASDLDDAFGGLADASGKPKPATDAIFESEMPSALIEYLADPDNADEAESIGRMSATQASRAIVKLETKLAAKRAEAKPQRSNAPAPIEQLRGGGASNNGAPDPANTKAYIAWANKQEFGR